MLFLGREVAIVVTTAFACYGAFRWPAYAYLLLLTAVAGGIWFVGRLLPSLLTVGTMIVAASIAQMQGGSALSLIIKDPPHVVLFIAVVALIGAAVETLRRARALAEQHAAELSSLNSRLKQEMEEVQTLSEHLHEANESLGVALAEATQTAARASALQEVTAALSLATTAPDVATAVLTQGVRAIHARRGCLILVDDHTAMQVIGDTGHSGAGEVRGRPLRSDADLPLTVAMRERRAVWLRSPAEYRDALARNGSDASPGGDVPALLALPLLHGDA